MALALFIKLSSKSFKLTFCNIFVIIEHNYNYTKRPLFLTRIRIYAYVHVTAVKHWYTRAVKELLYFVLFLF